MPLLEAVAFVRLGGQGDLRAGNSLCGRCRSHSVAAAGHGDGILGRRRCVLLEDGLDLHVALRHGELVVLDRHAAADDLPLLEVIAGFGRSGQANLRAGRSGGRGCGADAVSVIGDGNDVLSRGGRHVLPQRLDYDVSGDGHRGVHRILRTVDLPCLELLSFGRNKLALRQRILAAVQYLLGGHCGGDLIGQILRLGAAACVKSDGMLVALFKRCSYGDVLLRLGEGIGILPNRDGGGGAVDGQRAEHIALIGCNGEHDKLVLAEQRRAVLGGSRGIHHLDSAVFAILHRHLILRLALHGHLHRDVLLPLLSRTRDNIQL